MDIHGCYYFRRNDFRQNDFCRNGSLQNDFCRYAFLRNDFCRDCFLRKKLYIATQLPKALKQCVVMPMQILTVYFNVEPSTSMVSALPATIY